VIAEDHRDGPFVERMRQLQSFERRAGNLCERLRIGDAGPSQDWLNFVKSPRARNKIRGWFTKERREEAIEQGKDAIARAMRKQNLPLQKLMGQDVVAEVAAQMRYDGVEALYAARLCGAVLASFEMALHHKLCHTLGGSFNLPHAETHTIVLPHALAYNAAAAPEAMRRIAAALEGKSAPQAAYDLAKDNGGPVALKDIGMREADLDKALEIAMGNQYPNPRPLERKALRALLQDALEGTRPR